MADEEKEKRTGAASSVAKGDQSWLSWDFVKQKVEQARAFTLAHTLTHSLAVD